MGERLAILGADVLGLLIAESVLLGGEYDLVGFVDDRADAPPPPDAPLLGTSELLPQLRADGVRAIAVGIGDDARRREAAGRLRSLGFRLATVVHPAAFVSPRAELGAGVLVEALASVHRAARIGEGTVLMPHAWVAHDAEIGPFSWLSGHASVGGFARVGRECRLGAGSVVASRAEVPAGTVVVAGGRFP